MRTIKKVLHFDRLVSKERGKILKIYGNTGLLALDQCDSILRTWHEIGDDIGEPKKNMLFNFVIDNYKFDFDCYYNYSDEVIRVWRLIWSAAELDDAD